MRALVSKRALMLREARRFFEERGLLEVDCPILSFTASVDACIDLIPALYCGAETCYLHSSPEYGMKRLLAEGVGDIYQLSHVFRDAELGRLHQPEFMMAEWYRIGFSLVEMIEETAEFIHLFLGALPLELLTYRRAFLLFAGIDPFAASEAELRALCPGFAGGSEPRDLLLNFILTDRIEPKLGRGKLTALLHYPPSQAALAKTALVDGVEVAERFEIYAEGIELCNGYHELADPEEQLTRFEAANRERLSQGKQPLPIDRAFLQALKKGLPDCCGVAVGFDRLMLLASSGSELKEILPLPWSI